MVAHITRISKAQTSRDLAKAIAVLGPDGLDYRRTTPHKSLLRISLHAASLTETEPGPVITGEDGVPNLSDAPQERCLFGGEILHGIGSEAAPDACSSHEQREDGYRDRYTGEEHTN